MKTNAFLAVIGKDKPGIIAEVTGLLFRNRCNLEDISMTVLEGTLAMILVVQYPKAKKAALEADCRTLERKTGLALHWIKASGAVKPQKENFDRPLYLISAIGKDRTGIVHSVSRLLANYKININDLNSRVVQSGKTTVYAMMLEVELPQNVKFAALESVLKKLSAKLGIEMQARPVERLNF